MLSWEQVQEQFKQNKVWTVVVFLFIVSQGLGQIWPLFTNKTIPEWLAGRGWSGMSTVLYPLYWWLTFGLSVLLVISAYRRWGTREALLAMLLVCSIYLYSSLREVRRDFDCYVKPRRLTPEQVATIAAHLLERKPPFEITIEWPGNNGEAGQYASDFIRGFREGNWLVNPDPELADKATPQGMSLNCYSNMQTQTADNKRRQHDPRNFCEIAHEALTKAVEVGLGGGSRNELKDGEYKVVFTVGLSPIRIGCEEKEN